MKDNLDPARGIIYSVLLGTCLWVVIIMGVMRWC